MTAPRPLLWMLAAFATCGATCSRSEVESEERREVVSLDAGVRVEESASVAVDRQEVRVQGPVEVVRVEETFAAGVSLDGGLPAGASGGAPQPRVLVRRVTTTTHREPSTRTVSTDTHAEAHSEATATLSETRETTAAVRSDVEKHSDVGLSWPVKLAILAALLVGGYLAWRFRSFLM